MEEIEQTAYLLHSRPYQDNKVIVEFLTEFQGKLSAIAYISNTGKSNKKALLQPFMPLNIVVKGRGSLKTLSRIEAAEKSLNLTGNHLYSGFYINELQVRLLGEHVAYDTLYPLYHDCLKQLALQLPIEPILRRFETELLEELGLTIDYSVIFEQDHQQYHYIPEQGFIAKLPKSTAYCYQKEHLMQIAQQQFETPEVMRTYKLLMRQIYSHLLGDKPLNSRKLFVRK